MNIVLTGAAGFIGSHLTLDLLAKGHHVIAIDNLSTGSLENLKTVLDHPHLTLIIDDVQHQKCWEDQVKPNSVIIHLAATVGVKKVFLNAHETLTNNLDSTAVVLEVAKNKSSKVFFASTSEVYGQSGKDRLEETDALSVYTTDQGRSSYVISKLTNEISCLNYDLLNNVPVIIGRFFNVTGENQRSDFGMVVPTFIKNAQLGTPLTLYNDGLQSRSFCYIQDIIKAITGLITTPSAWGNIFNIGNDTAVTIKELAEYIVHKLKSDSEIRYAEMPAERAGYSEIHSRLPSMEKIYRYTNWKPSTPWKQAIDRLIAAKIKDVALEAL